MPVAELPACVFCGQPITAGEETAGRAPMAAHATCADAALADDAHWDAVSAGTEPEDEPDEQRGPEAGAGRRAGCLALSIALLAVALVVAAGLLAI